MVLQSSGGNVSLSYVQSLELDSEIRAIAALPNGTSLQQILLTDRLAKLDRSQSLPIDIAQAFQIGEADARSQRKNVWGVESKIGSVNSLLRRCENYGEPKVVSISSSSLSSLLISSSSF